MKPGSRGNRATGQHIGSTQQKNLANRVVVLVKILYNLAIERGWHRGANPAVGVALFAEPSRERYLQPSELPRFWAALEAEPSEKVRDAIKLLLWTGQRRMNVLAMRWADVNWADATWTIPHTKTGRHTVPLPTAALEILTRRFADKGASEYVLPGLHDRGHLQDIMRQWRAILANAELDDLRIHDLRRSLGSWQVKTGASLAIVGKTLGHRQPQTTAIYACGDADPVLAAMESATAAMLAAVKPPRSTARKARSGVTRASRSAPVDTWECPKNSGGSPNRG